jgi:tetratricopeptide (TPR) repeat protein
MSRSRSALLALFLLGCAPLRGEAYLTPFAAGERAFHAGRYLEAARAFDAAAAKAERVKDRDEARFLEARCYERESKWGEARAAYLRLIADSPDGPRTGRAIFDLAELEIQHGDAARGWAMLDEAMLKLPKHGLARPALRRLVDHAEETSGVEAALAFLDAHGAKLEGTELVEVLGYERALVLERAGRLADAHEAFVKNARRFPYPFGGLTDDALWRAALIDEELRRYEEAIAHLRELLSVREPASGGASYERPRFPEAQLKIALLYRDRLHDRKAARRELEQLYARHKATIKRDDAVWMGAVLARQDGDEEAACKMARRLVDEFPDSRYARCAREVCPSAPPAKRECADYIRRELRGDKE